MRPAGEAPGGVAILASVLSSLVHKDLSFVIRYVHLIQSRAAEGAAASEVNLLIEAASERVRRIGETIGAVETEPFGQLLRHLYWIGYWHGRGQPASYQSDLIDINERDLPGVIDAVSHWEARLLSPGLAEAVARSWVDRNFVNVVRDAFVYLEQSLRRLGRVPSSEGITAVPLVQRLLNPTSEERLVLPGEERTGGEMDGILQLFLGAFLVFRNPASHRFIEHDAQSADEILRLVDLCLRILGAEETDELRIDLHRGADTEAILRALEEVARRFPGSTVIRLVVDETDGSDRTLASRVEPSEAFREEAAGIEGVRLIG